MGLAGRREAERQRDRRQGRGGIGSAQGKEWATGETGREEEQDAKSPHWVSESCSFVRYPALLFPLSSVSSRVFGDVAGPAADQQGGFRGVGPQMPFFFSLF